MKMIGHTICCQTIDRFQLLQRHCKEVVRLLNTFFAKIRFTIFYCFCFVLFLFCHYFSYVNIKHENIHETTSIEIVCKKHQKFKVNRSKKKQVEYDWRLRTKNVSIVSRLFYDFTFWLNRHQERERKSN